MNTTKTYKALYLGVEKCKIFLDKAENLDPNFELKIATVHNLCIKV